MPTVFFMSVVKDGREVFKKERHVLGVSLDSVVFLCIREFFEGCPGVGLGE